MEKLLAFECPFCRRRYLGLEKYKNKIVTCPGCNAAFQGWLGQDGLFFETNGQAPMPLYPVLVGDDPELKELREQLVQERKRLQEQQEKKKKWEQIKEEKRRQEKKKSPWDGAFWEVTKEILFIIMVLVLIVPIAILYVGCLAFGGGKR